MNKHEAQALARKRPTIGALRAAIRQRRRLRRITEMSIVDRSLTCDSVLDIFEKALANRSDDEIVDSHHDVLMATNILWECL